MKFKYNKLAFTTLFTLAVVATTFGFSTAKASAASQYQSQSQSQSQNSSYGGNMSQSQTQTQSQSMNGYYDYNNRPSYPSYPQNCNYGYNDGSYGYNNYNYNRNNVSNYNNSDYNNYNQNYLTDYNNNYNHYYGWNGNNYANNYLRTNWNYFQNSGLFDRYPQFRYYFPDQLNVRHVRVIDRDNPDNFISIDNYLTGPYSLNQANVTVDSNTFTSISNSVNTNTNMNFSIDTGNNTISYNTIAGGLTTGNASISIY